MSGGLFNKSYSILNRWWLRFMVVFVRDSLPRSDIHSIFTNTTFLQLHKSFTSLIHPSFFIFHSIASFWFLILSPFNFLSSPFQFSPQTLLMEQPSLPPHNSTPTTLRGWHSRAQRNVFDSRSMEVILEQFVWYRSQRIRIKTRISNSSVCSGGNDFLAFLPYDSSLYHPLVGLVLNHNINHFLVGSPSRGQC